MSSRNVRRGGHLAKKKWENVQRGNEISENVNGMNDIETECRDFVHKRKYEEHVEEWDTKQEMYDHKKKKERLKREITDFKTEDINSGRLNCENSCHTSQNNVKKGISLKIKTELSTGKTDIDNDRCSLREEPLNEPCARKLKRRFCECDPYNSKGSGLTCIGILPGLNSIIESSDDSDQSCSSDCEGNENNKYDLLGRKIVCVSKTSSELK